MAYADAIVLFAHGAKDPEWSRPMRRIQAMAAELLPETLVELAFLELMAPTLPEAVARLAGAGAKRITIVPLFLAAGGHIKEDLPKLIAQSQQRYPGVSLTTTVPIGEDENLLAAIAAWVAKQRDRGFSNRR